uniref:Ion_trans domain-containing protein n=1 Tax=Steinernema glaseri TaxID=37863 RepID=A0A1I7Y2U1_9BILA
MVRYQIILWTVFDDYGPGLNWDYPVYWLAGDIYTFVAIELVIPSSLLKHLYKDCNSISQQKTLHRIPQSVETGVGFTLRLALDRLCTHMPV